MVIVLAICHLTVALHVHVSANCSEDNSRLSLGSGQLCRDLDSVLDELESGMTLRLEAGVHVVRMPHFIDTRGAMGVSISGSGTNRTVITCESELGLAFIGIANLELTGFTISTCGLTSEYLAYPLALLKQSLDIWILVPQQTKVALFIGDCKDVIMRDVHITNTTGLGLLGINIMGSSLLSRVDFTRNVRPQCLDSAPILPSFITPDIYNQVGGGAYFLYSDYRRNVTEFVRNASLYLVDCYFAHNSDCTYMSVISINFPFYTFNRRGLYEYAVGAGGGLSVILASNDLKVEAAVANSIFYRNSARYGGGAYVTTFAGFRRQIYVFFQNCTFLENCVTSAVSNPQDVYCRGGGGMAIFTDLVKPEDFLYSIPSAGEDSVVIAILDSRFTRNEAEIQGGGIMAYSFFSTPHANLDVRDSGHYSILWYLMNTTFTENFARYSSAAYLTQFANFGVGGSVMVIIQDLDISENYNQKTRNFFVNGDEGASTVHLKEVTCSASGAITFSYNRASALRIESTVLSVFDASFTFYQNQAHRGGALYFSGNSPALQLFPNCALTFVNNQAVVEGGAIYYDPFGTPIEILQPINSFGCPFFTIFVSALRRPYEHFGLFDTNISFSFTNNSAPLGGIMFGSTLEDCFWANNITLLDGRSLVQVLADYNSTFIFSENPTGENLVSTLPASITAALLFNSSEQPLTVFPGQEIDVGIEVLDEYGNVIPEVVTSVVTDRTNSVRSTLGSSGFWHTSVYESKLRVTGMYEGLVNISIVTESNSLSTTLSVNMTSCPIGFYIDSVNQRCTCDELLQNMSGASCLEDSVSFVANREFWIGVDPGISSLNSSDLIVHPCILNYCKILGNNTIDPPYFDSQCAHNRAGLLCGDCAEGFSVVFGTNECLQCSNYWLLLIPVFALAGFVLFAGIALLEITIDKGLTNAALFFASLVSFFQFLSPNLFTLLPFRLLVLQLGVSTCFYNGMTSLHRCYILLGFPLYLYILMAIFTVLCRRFTWLSTHFSPTKTLATLTVICYLSVLTTCLDIIVPVRVETLGGDASYRWMVDPTWQYFVGAHGFLAMLGFLLLIFYILLFPLVLLIPMLAYKFLKKFSPFLDAIWDAYKPKFRFWFSVRILILMILFLVTRTPQTYAYIFSGIIIVLFFNIQAILQPFKDNLANYIDAILTTLVTIYFWGAQAISVSDYTPPIKVLAISYIAVFGLVSYSIFGLIFAILLHRRFPSLWPWLVEKMRRYSNMLKKPKSEDGHDASVEGSSNEGDLADDDHLRTRTSLYLNNGSFAMSSHSSPYSYRPHVVVTSRYRESLLSINDPGETSATRTHRS